MVDMTNKRLSVAPMIDSVRGDYPAFQSSDFDSVAAAKQWAQNYHNKYGVGHE